MSIETRVDGDPGSARRCAVAVRALAARVRAAERLLGTQARLGIDTFDGIAARAYRARAGSMASAADDLDSGLTRLASALDRWADDLEDVLEEMAGVRDVAVRRLVLAGQVVHPHPAPTEEQRQLYERLGQIVASARTAEQAAQERYRAALSLATGISPPSGGPAGWSQEAPPAPTGLETELDRAVRQMLQAPPTPPANPGLLETPTSPSPSDRPTERPTDREPDRSRPPGDQRAPGEPGRRSPDTPAEHLVGSDPRAEQPAAPRGTPLPTLTAVALAVAPALPTLAAVLHPPAPLAVLGRDLGSDPPWG